MEQIRVETGAKTDQPAGGTVWTASSSEIWPGEFISFPAEQRERYQSVDGRVTGELRFNGAPMIGMGTTRFVLVTLGHPNRLKIWWPAMPSDNVDTVQRLTSVVVEDRGDTADA